MPSGAKSFVLTKCFFFLSRFSHAYREEGEGSGIEESGDRGNQSDGVHDQESEHDTFR